MDNKSIVSARQNQVYAYLSDEAVILDLQTGVYFGLNSIGAYIWKLLQKPVSISQIRDWVVEEYNVSAERCEQDIIDLVKKLAEVDLIEIKNAQDPQIS